MHPDPPDDNRISHPHYWNAKNAWRGALVRTLNGRPRTSTHPRAAYWREWQRKKKYGPK